MNIDDLHTNWGIDSTIDSSSLGDEALKTSNLHSKYLRFLTETKLIHRKLESDLIRMRTKKTRYYRGEMSREELAENNWNQYQGIKPMKSELENVLESDYEVMRLNEKLEYYRTFVTTIEYILKELNSRHFSIKAAIEFQKMQNGIN